MKIISGDGIPPRVMIKPILKTEKSKSGLDIPSDNDELPRAKVIQVPEPLQEVLKEGDEVYYIKNTRDQGLVKQDGVDYNVIPIGNIVAII